MSQDNNLLSLRIVTVDYYMNFPIKTLDSCYSEFRGSEIKQVPVIRIFGADSLGNKTCMHVHGVFPYLFIPYEGNVNDFEAFSYQIASNLDKAVNISLGQATSNTQHIFKITLVKGIPFYGYHSKAHLFAKIYLYNPTFIRRVSNLLQNGAINGKVNQPHESHIPFILQFFIDYNLYGMSFVHVPMEFVRHRINMNTDNQINNRMKQRNLLADNIERMSICRNEIDISATYILNRFQNSTNSHEHSNPGIASIWTDEKIRRDNMNTTNIPSLEPSQPEPRPNIKETDSAKNYCKILKNKLDSFIDIDKDLNETDDTIFLTQNTIEQQQQQELEKNSETVTYNKRIFNLKKLLLNSVYPMECNNDVLSSESILNATLVQDHFINQSNVADSRPRRQLNREKDIIEIIDSDESDLDEERILNLSQSFIISPTNNNITTLTQQNDEEHQILEIMKLLENNDNDIDNGIVDANSLLAPLSQPEQQPKFSLSQISNCTKIDKTNDNEMNNINNEININDYSFDSDDDLLNEFAKNWEPPIIAQMLENNNELIESKDGKSSVPQLDGGFDDLLIDHEVTPQKPVKTNEQHVLNHLPSGGKSRYKPVATIEKLNKPQIRYNSTKSPDTIENDEIQNRKKARYNDAQDYQNNVTVYDNVIDLTDDLSGGDDNDNDNNHNNVVAGGLVHVKKKLEFNNENIDENENIINSNLNNKINNTPILNGYYHDDNITISKINDSNNASQSIISNKINTINTNVRTKDKINNFIHDKKLLAKCRVNLNILPIEIIGKNIEKLNTNEASSSTFSQKTISSTPIKRYPKRNRVPRKYFDDFVQTDKRLSQSTSSTQHQSKNNKINKLDIQQPPVQLSYLDNIFNNKLSKCELANRFDREKNFFPEPGPSHINYYQNIDFKDYYTIPAKNCYKIKNTDLDEENLGIESFYQNYSQQDDQQLDNNINAFQMETNQSTIPELSCTVIEKVKNNFKMNQLNRKILITLKQLPPTYKECVYSLDSFNIPLIKYQQPFYSNINDVTTTHSTNKREIGNDILRISSTSLNDIDDFTSGSIINAGLNTYRKIDYQKLTNTNVYNNNKNNKKKRLNTNQIKEYLSNEHLIKISPSIDPPSLCDTNVWLLARHIILQQLEIEKQISSSSNISNIGGQGNFIDLTDSPSNSQQINSTTMNYSEHYGNFMDNLEKDSPIKIRREKTKMIIDNYNDVNEDNNNLTFTSNTQLTNSLDSRNINSNSILTPPPPPPPPPPQVQSSTTSESVIIPTEVDRLKYNLNFIDEDVICLDDLNTSQHLINKNYINVNNLLYSEQLKHNSEEIPTTPEPPKKRLLDASMITKFVYKNLDRSSFVKNLNLDTKSAAITKRTRSANPATLHNNLFDSTMDITNISSDNFKMELENFQNAKLSTEYNFLTILSLELHVETRGNLKPNPEYDGITAIFYAIENNVPPMIPTPLNSTYKKSNGFLDQSAIGIITLLTDNGSKQDDQNRTVKLSTLLKDYGTSIDIKYVKTEYELLQEFTKIIEKWDPDIYVGYEIQMNSWGYLIQRGYTLQFNLLSFLSRIPKQKFSKNDNELNESIIGGVGGSEDYWVEMESNIKLSGRILLDVWRLLRYEISITSYTFENVMYHILHRRYPLHSHQDLTRIGRKLETRWIVYEYFLDRVKGTLDLLNQLDIIGRTCELAKLFGIQFYEVFSRGSQYRVESMMLRIAKPKNIVSVSPSVQQRAHMRAPEYLPLILEPISRMYTDPMIVLDFQSLYPSMIIAYNYCFSTCLGRVEHLGQSDAFEFGASQLRVSQKQLKELIDKDLITSSPCGCIFVKSSVREGILPRLLREILDTRLMVKQSMKLHKSDNLLQRILHSRQLGLKLIANVTYGYTAANFSGRMPCVEVGDSVVSKGRETLERAIKLVQNNKKWNANVVYGDTDSLFVLVPGRSRNDAFLIGSEIAEAVTNDNPHPVKLKLEKVYQPCILQTKKRYVGYMYETKDQKEPIYEAKGIETVRRDGCPIVAKTLEKTLKILFDSCDVSLVKKYICRQFTNILSDRINIHDLIFAKEFRGSKGYKPGACVPALELTRKWKQIDPRSEPRCGERVPYIVVNGPPGVPLIRLIRSPYEYLDDIGGLKINALYYITKVLIPPLNRCLLLIGTDVQQWFADLPRKTPNYLSKKISNFVNNYNINNNCNDNNNVKKSTISQYFATTNCVIDCGQQTKNGICDNCMHNTQLSAIILTDKMSNIERKYDLVRKICKQCCGRDIEFNCKSLDCPVLFTLYNRNYQYNQIEYFRNLLESYIL